ncbi:DUF1800 domain-containing protein [Granulicella tundricola]|uniref:DUF1800 domain-containing protein n=1 Tax=Granulicella tundricola (strain ATCC BAA-1859 / DSM 23138 / MP5ACTX9) TaxID=1198114 RepID=E8WVL4_GRATM|nr:DUF1800 domain-containing protein [Granulicella tundricola]ADW69543.1 protein of unknown function DUF1800 [Granulicella tundricola MP5ACTX9]
MKNLGTAILLISVAPLCGGQRGADGVAKLKLPPSKIALNAPLTTRERAVQILNRFTYGPRPGDVEAVMDGKWFDQQLNPGSIPDGPLEKRLGDYPTLRMRSDQLQDVFPDRGAIQLVADGRRPYPLDPLIAGVYEVEVAKLLAEREDKQHPHAELTDAEKAAAKKADQATASRVAGVLFSMPKGQRMAALNAMPVEDRIAFANNVSGDQKNTLMADFNPREREAVNAIQGGVGAQYRAYDELAQAHVLREVLSERQVQEVMTEFWFNHFNVFFNKDSDQWYTTSFERDVIRPNALGKFRDLLLATAESPAMMVYLDNWLSIGPNSLANGVDPKKPNSKPGNKGLNENYGREVMELHTLGVGGGYSQADVTHLSAILTGWGVDRPNMGGGFQFDPKRHEPGTKEWFGHTIDEQGRVEGKALGGNNPDGMKQGVAALTLLAAAPQTAHFISFLLAQRFVADEPPAALVDRMTKSYLDSDGDIKVVLTTLVTSPEFNSHRYFRNKVKTPEEFLASSFRAMATDPSNPGAVVGKLRELGEAPYQALPPTGYIMTADHWMNTGALVARLNFSDQLTHGKFGGQKFDSSRVLAFGLMADRGAGAVAQAPAVKGKVRALPVAASDPMGPDVALRVLEGTLIGGEVSVKTDEFIHSQMAAQPASNPTETLNLLTALLLGSPEFQVR